MIRASEFTVYVRDRSLRRVGVLAGHDLDGLAFDPARSGVGTWKVSLPDQVRSGEGWSAHEMCVALRQPGAGIVVRRNGRTVFSGPMVTRDLTRTRGDLRGAWEFSGESDECVLDDALAWPVPSNPVPQAGDLAADARSGTGSAVIVGYVRANIGEGAPVARRGGFAARLVTAGANVSLGSAVSESVRYENLLAVCQRVSRQSGAMFRVVDEGGSGEVGRLVLQTYVAADRSLDTRWTVAHGFLDKLEWKAGAPGVSRPLVGGSGVGEYRPMVAPTTSESVAAEAVWGRKREAFIDSRGVDVVAELEQRGLEALESPTAGLVADPSDETASGWGSLWDVGDELVLPETGVRYPITGVAVAFVGESVRVQAVLGALADDEAVQRSVESRVSNLERNESGVPVGTVAMFYGPVAPRGWLMLKGTTVSADLYPALAEFFGVASGSFPLPNMSGRFPVGVSAESEFNALGKTGGVKTVTLTSGQVPALSGTAAANGGHSHSIGGLGRFVTTDRTADFSERIAPTATGSGTDAVVPAYGAQTSMGSEAATSAAPTHTHTVSVNPGGGAEHPNLPPYFAINFMIKA